MSVYIDMAHIALALAFGGGFFVGAFVTLSKAKRTAQTQARRYYRAQYNVQMQELCTRYRQERIALIHRYEGLTAEVEMELKEIQRATLNDQYKTAHVFIASNAEAMGIEEASA